MNGIYLIIGGNMGDRLNYLQQCVTAIGEQVGHIEAISALYETASWGNTGQDAFLNRVLFVKSALTAKETLDVCLSIEKQMGRVRDVKWGARTIDIDILFYNDAVIREADLRIPHPHLQERRFVLVPLDEIAPAYLHPVFRKTVHELLMACQDRLEVTRVM